MPYMRFTVVAEPAPGVAWDYRPEPSERVVAPLTTPPPAVPSVPVHHRAAEPIVSHREPAP
jgi:hypothetical protein